MRLTRRRFVLGSAGGSLSLAGCLGGAGDRPEAESPAATTAGSGDGSAATTVAMVNTSFDPVRASVEPGSTVEWANRDGVEHTVTAARFHDAAAEWSFSETVPAGGNTTFAFQESGVYEYYCTNHGKGTMCGAVVVGDATLDATLPCEGGGGSDGDGGTTTDGGGDDGAGGGGGGGYY